MIVLRAKVAYQACHRWDRRDSGVLLYLFAISIHCLTICPVDIAAIVDGIAETAVAGNRCDWRERSSHWRWIQLERRRPDERRL